MTVANKTLNYLYIDGGGVIRQHEGSRSSVDDPAPASLRELRNKARECYRNLENQPLLAQSRDDLLIAIINIKIDKYNQKVQKYCFGSLFTMNKIQLEPAHISIRLDTSFIRLDTSFSSFMVKNREAETILKSSEFGPLIKNPDILFHGIKCDFWKIPSILQHGILSKAAAENVNLKLGFNYGVQHDNGTLTIGYNQERGISLARSPVHDQAIGYEAGAFGIYIRNSIAFAIKEQIVRTCKESIPGEAIANQNISKEDIIGIVVNKDLLDLKLSQIDILDGGSYGVFHLRCQSLYNFIKNEYGLEDHEIESAISNPIDADREIESLPNDLREEAIKEKMKKIKSKFKVLMSNGISKKFGKDITLLELLDKTIPSDLKIYTTNGFEVNRKRYV